MRPPRTRLTPSLRLAALCGLLALGATSAPAQAPEPGDEAPDFTLESLDGGRVSLSDFRGRVVFINFFGFS